MDKYEKKYLDGGKYRLRDYAAFVAITTNMLILFGAIGKFYVDAYRINQLEKTLDSRSLIINSLQLQFNQHLNYAEGKVKELDNIIKRVEACCPLYDGRGK